MNTNPMPNPLDRRALFPHQAEFTKRFLADDSQNPHLLIGMPGAGKTFTAAAVLGAVIEASPNQRIILIIPPSEAVQHQVWLSAAGRAEKIRWIDFRTFRELEAESAQEKGPWSSPGIYAMSAETARRTQVHASLLTQSWALMILSDARVLVPEEGSVIDSTELHPPGTDVRKTLLVSSYPQARCLDSAIKHLSVCEWILPVSDRGGNPWPPAVTSMDRLYSPSELERAFRDRLGKFIKTAATNRRGQFVAQQLAARTLSSPLAIESAMRRLQAAIRTKDTELAWLRSAAALVNADAATYHSNPRFTEEDNLTHDAISDAVQSVHRMAKGTAKRGKTIWKDLSAAAVELEGLLADFDKIYRDPKLATLLDLVRELGADGNGKPRPICVFTSFKVTASYVSSAIAEKMRGVLSLTSDTGFVDSQAVLETYNTRGGILVATSASAIGMDLSRSEMFIHYDLPLNPDEFQSRVARAPCAGNVRLVEAVK